MDIRLRSSVDPSGAFSTPAALRASSTLGLCVAARDRTAAHSLALLPDGRGNAECDREEDQTEDDGEHEDGRPTAQPGESAFAHVHADWRCSSLGGGQPVAFDEPHSADDEVQDEADRDGGPRRPGRATELHA